MTGVMNQLWIYGDPIIDQTIGAKVLRNLTPRFDLVVAIEESKDLTTFIIRGLISNDLIYLKHCNTNKQAVDIFTKASLVQNFIYILHHMWVCATSN